MNKRIVAVVLCLAFSLPPPVEAQTFAAPQPKASAPAASSAGGGKSRGTRRGYSTAPDSQCAQMTKDWADYRPVLDFPSAQGRTSYGDQVAAIEVCRSEQAARPSDLRVAFLFARALEVNNKGSQSTGLFRQLSDAGYAPATTQLARAYHFGSGLAPRPDPGLRPLRQGGEGGRFLGVQPGCRLPVVPRLYPRPEARLPILPAGAEERDVSDAGSDSGGLLPVG